MKALTLKHPWPWAVVKLGKRIENRTWEPDSRLPVGSWLAIHGGKITGGRTNRMACKIAADLAAREGRTVDFAEVFLEGVVAVCQYGGTDLTEVEMASPWYCGPVGWRLYNLLVLPRPVPCSGAQGLWDLPRGTEAFVRQQCYAEGLELPGKGKVTA